MGTLKITPPDRTTPGYLRRMRQVMKMQQMVDAGDPAVVDLLVQMLAPYVTSYEGYASIEDAIEDASREQYDEIFKTLQGK